MMGTMAKVDVPALVWRPYQIESIDDPKLVQLDFWSRQSGKDFTTAFKTVMRGLPSWHDWIIGSLTQRHADLNFEKCCRHARAMEVAIKGRMHDDDFDGECGGRMFGFTARTLTLPNGNRIISLPGRDPNSIAGYTGALVISEFALFPDGGHKHWATWSPVALNNGLPVWIITTPRGKDTRAYEMRQNRRGRYSVRTVDVYRAVKDGMVLRDEDGKPCSVAEFQEIYADPIGWQTEFLCQECDDITALLAWNVVELAYEKYAATVLDLADDGDYDPQAENVWLQKLAGCTGRLTAGWDVARRKHLSVLWVNEEVGDRQWLRLLVLMRRCSFPYQNAIIRQGMDAVRSMTGCGDSTGLGLESNERLEAAYPSRWRGVNFGGSRKIGLASLLQKTWQDGNQAIPATADMIACDLHALQRQVKGEDRMVIHETENAVEPDSHCDMAWANALCLEAASVRAQVFHMSILE